MWKSPSQRKHPVVAKCWDRPVPLWAQHTEQSFPCVHHEVADTCSCNGLHESRQLLPTVMVIHAETMLHSDWNNAAMRARCTTSLGHVLYDFGFFHQTSSKVVACHLRTWTSDVQVNFVEARLCTERGSLSHLGWATATNLHCDRPMSRVKTQQLVQGTIGLGSDDMIGRIHLCEQERALRQQTGEGAVVQIGPCHHRRH
mmetsp:Transcript_47992/g.154838  ORF Transcript_47992/g.154838 Transcript_47992/m.154838 type:complete len:200 (-) Transcript_47992:270-869(-)